MHAQHTHKHSQPYMNKRSTMSLSAQQCMQKTQRSAQSSMSMPQLCATVQSVLHIELSKYHSICAPDTHTHTHNQNVVAVRFTRLPCTWYHTTKNIKCLYLGLGCDCAPRWTRCIHCGFILVYLMFEFGPSRQMQGQQLAGGLCRTDLELGRAKKMRLRNIRSCSNTQLAQQGWRGVCGLIAMG